MPDEDLTIPFEVTGLSGALAAFKEVGEAAKSVEQFAKKSGASSGKFTGGPRQRLTRLLSELAQAQKEGNTDAVGDISDAIRRAERQISSGQPKSTASKIAGLIRSTRVGADGVMPLIGQLLDVLGPEGSMVSLIGGGAIKAAEAIGQLTAAAAQAGAQFNALRLSTGGTGSETALASQIGGALGISPEQVGGLSSNLQQSISGGDAIAQSAAAQAGVANAGPRGYTAVDEGRNLLKIADYLRSIKSDDDAIRYARRLGPVGEALLPYRNLAQNQVDLIHQTAQTQNSIFTPEMQKQSANFNSSTSLLKQALDNLTAATTGPATVGLTRVASDLTQFFNTLARHNKDSPALQVAASTAVFGFGGLISSLFGLGGKKTGGMSEQAKNTAALDRNTKATQDAVKGVYGHGANVGRAIPSAFGSGNGYALQQQHYMSGALTLGALT